jgi:hypothetical protein
MPLPTLIKLPSPSARTALVGTNAIFSEIFFLVCI